MIDLWWTNHRLEYRFHLDLIDIDMPRILVEFVPLTMDNLDFVWKLDQRMPCASVCALESASILESFNKQIDHS